MAGKISNGSLLKGGRYTKKGDAAKRRPIKHLMVNTNGIRVATEDGFAERLAEYMPHFELYLQFDSLRREPLMHILVFMVVVTRLPDTHT